MTGKDGGLGLHHNTIFQASAGNTYSLEAAPGFSATQFGEYWRVWIDFNGDYDFSDEGEEVFAGGAIMGALALQVEIPDDAVSGITRMRIAMKYGTLPPLCGTYGYGEVEEYGLLIGNSANLARPVDGEALEFLPKDVEKETEEEKAVTVYPNPASEYIRVDLRNWSPQEKVEARIITSEGRQVKTLLLNMSGFEPFEEIPVNNLPEGIYRLELYSKKSVQINRFVITR